MWEICRGMLEAGQLQRKLRSWKFRCLVARCGCHSALRSTSTIANAMAAPSIPNLNTLLSSRGGARGGGRGRGRGGPRGQHGDDPAVKDRIVQRTDDDAADARMSAVSIQYLDDPFALYFAQDKLARRYPIINRGMFNRGPRDVTQLTRSRDICPYDCHRQPRKQVPLPISRHTKADHIPRGWIRHPVLPSHLAGSISQPDLP